jgi:hypothetical protein
MQLFHTRRRAMMEELVSKVEELVSMTREVKKDPLDLIGMLDGIIEYALRSSGGQQSVGTHQTSSDAQQTFTAGASARQDAGIYAQQGSTAGARVCLKCEAKARQVSTAGASAHPRAETNTASKLLGDRENSPKAVQVGEKQAAVKGAV